MVTYVYKAMRSIMIHMVFELLDDSIRSSDRQGIHHIFLNLVHGKSGICIGLWPHTCTKSSRGMRFG